MSKVFKAYCPMMKGVCVNGFVKGMPEDDNGVRTKCAFFIQLAGKNPQTDEVINDPGCSIAFIPIIQLEGNNFMRQAIASTDKAATEIKKHHASFIGALPEEMRINILKSNPLMIERNGSKKHE